MDTLHINLLSEVQNGVLDLISVQQNLDIAVSDFYTPLSFLVNFTNLQELLLQLSDIGFATCCPSTIAAP